LEVHPQRMRANIDSLRGLVFAEAAAKVFARPIGKAQAHALLESLSAQTATSGTHLRELCLAILQSDDRLRGHVSTAEIESAFDADLAAQVAARVAAPQFAALRS
jgi:3-carboxy-cis,cis-muconate cycloisomerase